MVEETKGSDWTFVIDTDEYAGNFEREMCAYITGQVGECGVGADFSDIAREENPKELQEEFDDKVAHVPDDKGCARPVTIWSTPGWFNDGMGSHWRWGDNDEEKQLAKYVESVIDYEMPHLERTREIYEKIKSGDTVEHWTLDAAEREMKRHEKNIEKAKKRKKVAQHPAYMSVGIWFHEKPSDELIVLMKKRAQMFIEYRKAHLQSWEQDFRLSIEGFRLIQHIKTEKVFKYE